MTCPAWLVTWDANNQPERLGRWFVDVAQAREFAVRHLFANDGRRRKVAVTMCQADQGFAEERVASTAAEPMQMGTDED